MDTKSPISLGAGLPDDIIHEVYRVSAQINPPQPPRPRGSGYTTSVILGLITLTHVCKRWRKIGLEISSLWASIVCIFPPDVTTILQRSRKAHLTLNLSNSEHHGRGIWTAKKADRLLSRSRSLQFHLDGFTNTISKAWTTYLSAGSFQDLTNLCITAENPSPISGLSLEAPNLRALTTNMYFTLKAASLRTLELRGGHWHWRLVLDNIGDHPLLREFDCEGVAGDSDDEYEFESDAECTALQDSFALVEGMGIPHTVHLPYLESLNIPDWWEWRPSSSRLELLRCLDVPARIPLHIKECRGREYFLRWLSRPELAYAPRDTMTLSDPWADEYPLVMITITEGKPHLEPKGDVPVDSVQLSTSLAAINMTDILEALGTSTAFSIRVLIFIHDCLCYNGFDECFGTMGYTDLSCITTPLRRFTNVSELHLLRQGHSQTRLISMLRAPASHTDWVFPALHTLVLELERKQPAEFWTQLRAVLASRRAEGRPVERLIVRGSGACHVDGLLVPEPSVDWSAKPDDEVKEYIAAWLTTREITFAEERELVEVVDERKLACDCLDETGFY
ncbi:hypothetical protein PENSPDRAFT_758146 [Peniophora sp. CONT]|nr:hypothetical protein PENSPDRAFT_758146 [Peniophora sp. CONT]